MAQDLAERIRRIADAACLPPDRVITSAESAVALVYFAHGRYAMVEADEDGEITAMLADRRPGGDCEAWTVANEAGDILGALRRVDKFMRGEP